MCGEPLPSFPKRYVCAKQVGVRCGANQVYIYIYVCVCIFIIYFIIRNIISIY